MPNYRGQSVRADVVQETINGTPTNSIFNELRSAAALVSATQAGLAGLLTYKTTASVESILVGGTKAVLERKTENGIPVASRALPETALLGSTLRWYDGRTAYTWDYLREALTDQVRAQGDAFIVADVDLTSHAVLCTLFDTTPRVNETGAPVLPVYNGDDAVVPPYRFSTFASGHNHFLTTGSTALEGADVKALVDTVTEHGHAETTGRLLLLVNEREAATIAGFRVAKGDPFDYIPATGAVPYLTNDNIVGATAPGEYSGLAIDGSFGRALVHISPLVPAGYVVAVATEGTNSPRNVISFREHVRQDYRGLLVMPGSNSDYPLQDSYFVRGFGTGVRQRGAAAVMQVTAGSTYTVPAGFTHGSY